MSSSKVFKDRGDFRPEQLLKRPSAADDRWRPLPLPLDERQTAATRPSHSGEEDEPTAETEDDAERGMNREEQISGTGESRPAGPDSAAPESAFPPPASIEPPAVDLEAVREEAYERGIEEGMRRAHDDFVSSAAALNQACEQLNSIRETILKNSKEELIELVLVLSEKIIRHSVTDQSGTIVATVEDALRQAVRSSEFVVYLNPDDVSAVSEQAEDLVSLINGLEHIVIKRDASIERGGCKVESDNCTVDATLAGQLQIVREQIQENS